MMARLGWPFRKRCGPHFRSESAQLNCARKSDVVAPIASGLALRTTQSELPGARAPKMSLSSQLAWSESRQKLIANIRRQSPFWMPKSLSGGSIMDLGGAAQHLEANPRSGSIGDDLSNPCQYEENCSIKTSSCILRSLAVFFWYMPHGRLSRPAAERE